MDSSKAQVQVHNDDHDMAVQAHGNELKTRRADSFRKICFFRGRINSGRWIKEHIEPWLRKVVLGIYIRIRFPAPPSYRVRQEVETGLGISEQPPRSLLLRFMKRPASEIYTGNKVVADDGSTLQIAVFDVTSQSPMLMDVPLSIEVCVLDGGFNSYDWTAQQFNANILRETRKQAQLLTGNRFIKLINGVGCIDQVYINDISKITRSGKFKLGVKIVEPIPDIMIREGISEAFKVKHIRGALNKKHKTPSLKDEVWRLKTIAKGGKRHTQLCNNGINTVEDLLQLYHTNPDYLKRIIGFGTNGRKQLDKLIQHARAHAVQEPNAFAGQPHHVPMAYDENVQAMQGVEVEQVQLTSTSQIGEAAHNSEQRSIDVMAEFPELLNIDENFWSHTFGLNVGEVGCSNSNGTVYMRAKGRGTSVWDDIRNAVYLFILRLTKRKTNPNPALHNS